MHRFSRATSLGVGLALCALLAASASAQEAAEWDDSFYPFARPGVYIGIRGLLALENFDRDAAIEGGEDLDIGGDDAGGFGARVGYRMNDYFAAEALLQYYANFGVTNRDDGVNDHFNGWSLSPNVKGYPFQGRLQPYAVAGVGLLVFNEKRGDDLGAMVRAGGGVDVYLSDNFVLDLEIVYVLPAGALDDYQFTTFAAGIQYRY